MIITHKYLEGKFTADARALDHRLSGFTLDLDYWLCEFYRAQMFTASTNGSKHEFSFWLGYLEIAVKRMAEFSKEEDFSTPEEIDLQMSF